MVQQRPGEDEGFVHSTLLEFLFDFLFELCKLLLNVFIDVSWFLERAASESDYVAIGKDLLHLVWGGFFVLEESCLGSGHLPSDCVGTASW